jgi:tetrahydromethanopterin S-methyltransferase subunit F
VVRDVRRRATLPGRGVELFAAVCAAGLEGVDVIVIDEP